ncbi:phenylalanine--tRNA ligase subunit alpha [Candidatus Daviesbacteria bacterium]|nr:phenylalanine--tRNA ligase subunit alpha [Candidatus Daviesbacteria bacterium]
MEEKLKKIQIGYQNQISSSKTLKELDIIFIALFGKKGGITLLPKQFNQLPKDQLKTLGPLFNQVKQELEATIEKRRNELREANYKALRNETFEAKGSRIKQRKGHLHPVTQFENEIVSLFNKLGFVQSDAPHIDTDYNNFEVLNIPANHPARDLWDTLYIDTTTYNLQPTKLLLRTHTSNAQIRILKNNKPPIRMMSLGRCFRYENVDARHEHTLEQFEIVYVDKGVSMAHLQFLSEYFFKSVLGKDIKVRLRPKYYPFVEPGVGIDATCVFCKGKGCKVCGGVGWMELAGAGMMHPNVLKAGGIDPKEYSGIAWGVGPERMAMLKYGVEDIREFNSGNLSFLEKF